VPDKNASCLGFPYQMPLVAVRAAVQLSRLRSHVPQAPCFALSIGCRLGRRHHGDYGDSWLVRPESWLLGPPSAAGCPDFLPPPRRLVAVLDRIHRSRPACSRTASAHGSGGRDWAWCSTTPTLSIRSAGRWDITPREPSCDRHSGRLYERAGSSVPEPELPPHRRLPREPSLAFRLADRSVSAVERPRRRGPISPSWQAGAVRQRRSLRPAASASHHRHA
jgi:hypothetical protein